LLDPRHRLRGRPPVREVPRRLRGHPADPDLHPRPRPQARCAGDREREHRGRHRRGHGAGAGGRAAGGGARMTQTAPEPRTDAAGQESRFCLCESYARVTERAALSGARWLGRADQGAAEEDASTAMRIAIEQLPIDGRIVIGAGGEDSQLAPGEQIGSGGVEVDLALDPLEGRGVVARGGYGAMSMVAVGDRGAFQTLPDMYMRKMAVGPKARGAIDLMKPVGDNIRAIAEAFGRMVNDVTTIVLDRPRHHDLIEEIRVAGARIKLIQDGDVTASISAAVRG